MINAEITNILSETEIQQLLNYELMSNIFFLIFNCCAIILSVFLYKKAKSSGIIKAFSDDIATTFTPIFVILGTVYLFIAIVFLIPTRIDNIIKIKTAPKIYTMEKLRYWTKCNKNVKTTKSQTK
jgi:hypothetical protein